MDKNEYNLKLEEIDQLVDQGNYTQAAAVADQIDWRRVRNVRTLCLISEIYEAENRYEDSKTLLLRAYRRSPVGRAILYRLVEVTIKLKQFDEAIEYYSEYVQAAPHDNSKYILKYKIYRGRGSSVEEQIEILKEYLDQEYSEKYAYELAKLYQEADRIQECLATCDDLVLWFHSGKYVIKALELKMKYASLTPKQQEIYDHRFDEPEEPEAQEDLLGQEKQIVTDAPETSEAAAIMEDAQKAIADELARDAAQEQAPAEQAQETAERSEQPGAHAAMQTWVPGTTDGQTAEENASAREAGELSSAELSQEASDAETAAGVKAAAQDLGETQIYSGLEDIKAELNQSSMSEIKQLVEEAKAAPEAEEEAGAQGDLDEPVHDAQAFDEQLNKYNTQELQTEMIKSMREIVSGVGLRDLVDEDQEAEDRVIEESKRIQETSGVNVPRRLTMPELQKRRDAGQLSIDDVLLSMGDRGNAVREAAAKAAPPTKPQPAGVLSAVDEALLNMGISPEKAESAPERPLDELFKRPETETAEAGEETEEIAQELEELNRLREEDLTEPEQAAGQPAEAVPSGQAAEQTAAAVPGSQTVGQTTEAQSGHTAGQTAEASGSGQAAEQTTEAVPDGQVAGQTMDAQSGQAVGRMAEAIESGQAAEQMTEAVPSGQAASQMAETIESGQEAAGTEDASGSASGEEDVRIAEAPSHKEVSQDMSMREIIGAKTRRIPTEEIAQLHDQGAQQDAPEETMGAQATGGYLNPELKGFFAGYLTVRDMERQIAEAVEQALAKGADRTSRGGNILIFGGHGCGKTTIATGLAKAIAQERGDQSVKMARIYATDLNRKDIAATVAKIAGGILIVEEAGDLEDSIADQLTTAMEFRTDGLIVILEDEQRYMHDLLMRHPRMTMKFTSQIYIPNFTIQDLVNFGSLYADDRDYWISDEAVSALGNKLSTMAQAAEAPLSITAVLDQVDQAILRANKFGRKLFSGKKRYDAEGRVVLTEKDFR